MSRRHPSDPEAFERWLIEAGRRDRVPTGARERALGVISARVGTAVLPVRAAFLRATWSLCAIAAASFALSTRPMPDGSQDAVDALGSGGRVAARAPSVSPADPRGVTRGPATNSAGAGRF